MLLFFGATIICECSIRCLRWRTHSSSLVISDDHIKRRSRTDLGEVILFGSIPELMPPLHEALTLPKDEALAASLIICLNKYGQINEIRKLGPAPRPTRPGSQCESPRSPSRPERESDRELSWSPHRFPDRRLAPCPD